MPPGLEKKRQRWSLRLTDRARNQSSDSLSEDGGSRHGMGGMSDGSALDQELLTLSGSMDANTTTGGLSTGEAMSSERDSTIVDDGDQADHGGE